MIAIRRSTPRRQQLDVVVALVARDVTLRYRRSALGILWSQIAPLVTLGVLTFLFTRVVPLSIPDYGAFVLIGLLAWTWFSGAVTTATASVSGSADLVRRPGFAVSLLPVVAVISNLIQFVLTVPVLVLAVLVTTGRIPLTIALLPLIMALQALVLLGPSWLLAALNVRFRDVSHLVAVMLFPLFYVTPVFYEASAVPDRVRWAYRLNPLVHLIEAYRDVALLGRWPSAAPLTAVALAAVAAGWLGHRVFDTMAATFPDEI